MFSPWYVEKSLIIAVGSAPNWISCRQPLKGSKKRPFVRLLTESELGKPPVWDAKNRAFVNLNLNLNLC